jgi:phosphate transport system substrate-binding protein
MRPLRPSPALGAAAVVLLLLPPPAHAQQRERTVRLSGSTSTLALAADLAYFYRRETRNPPRFSIVGGGTAAGIADAARGIVDGGLISRDLGGSDPLGLRFTPIALSGVCLVTNAANPVPNLTRAQVQDLIADRVQSWEQVPGAALRGPLAPVALARTAGARSVFESVFVDVETPQDYNPRTLLTASQVRAYVLSTPNSWGYVDLAYTRGLHVVPYEGVPCTRATIRAGTYPGARPLGVVTRGRPRGALARFLRWARRDATARRVIGTRYIAP